MCYPLGMARLRRFAAFSLAASLAPAHAAPICPAPVVTVAAAEPTRAILTWPAGPGVVGYFVQYSTGKFPTQVMLQPPLGGGPVTAELENLEPGRTYTIGICTGLAPNACPGPDSPQACNSTVEVTAPTARAGVTQPEPSRAVCRAAPDTVWRGYWVGDESEAVVSAESADACCQACAAAGQRLPYVRLCTHFTFDPSARRCFLYGETVGTLPAPGAVTGEVLAWPRPEPP